jgi:DNA modification methylase
MTAGDPDAVPAEAQGEPVSQRGEVFELGPHRLMCGDSTSADDVHSLIGDDLPASLLHADPPYGMNKENEGVENDNLHESKLDSFLMDFWKAWRPKLANNSSAYIWGTAEDLWRLWYVGGLKDSERMTMRNEIVWKKDPSGLGDGQNNGIMRSYGIITERCLFFMIGEQGFNNNADNYWEGWEPIRSYLENEMKRIGWKTSDLNRITGTNMAAHWVTKSQWGLITEPHYKKIQAAAREHDAFKREHDELKREHDELKREHDELKRDFYATRAFFDNTHENMTDVWEYPRVKGEDRHGHATPKPVDMIARAIKSACPKGGTVLEPFAGSGSTLIAAAMTGRICRTMEISPRYCDVIRRRWTKFAKENNVEPGTGALE